MKSNFRIVTMIVGALFMFSNPIFAIDSLSVNIQQADKIFLENNFLLLANQYNINVNEALTIQAKLYPNPTFSADFNAYVPDSNKTFQIGHQGEKAFSVEQLILIGGKRKTQIQIARTNIDIARYEFEDLLRNLKFQLHSSLYKILQSEIVLKKYDGQLTLLDSIISNYEYQSKKGNIPVKEVVRLKTVYFGINNNRSEIAKELNDEMSNVRVLLGTTAFVVPVINQELLDGYLITSPEKIIDEAIQNRPDLKLIETQQNINELNLKLQKQLAIPDVTINASYDQRGGAFNDQVNTGISMPLPIWNRNIGNIKAARFQTKSSDALTKQKKIEVKTEAQQAYDDFARSLKEYKKSQQLYNADFENVFNGISENFQKRNISLIEFVDFVEAYNESIAELQRIKTQFSLAAETINYVTSKDIY